MSSKEILWQLLNIFRGSFLTINNSFELILQILAWAKLSVNEELPPNLRLSQGSKPNTSELLLDSFNKLSEYSKLSENKVAFENITPIVSTVPSNEIVTALDFALDAAQNKLLDHFDISEELYISVLSEKGLFIPKEVIEVMSSLAGNLEGKSVYCPYDTFCLIAHHVSEYGGKPSVEIPWRSPIPRLINILTSSNVHMVIGDPLRQPSLLNEAELYKFDTSIAFPPFGTKVDIEVVNKDLFNRFEEKTSSGSVLTLRHIIAQTKEKAVIALPSSILFGRGVEHTLRKNLLLSELIEAVINMPPALLPFTPIPFSILVLNIRSKSSTVRFVNGAAEKFSTKAGRNRTKLVNWESLIETFQNSNDEALTANVPIKEILKNDANLEVCRYLLPPKQKVIKNLFSKSVTRKLKELVKFLRPSKLFPQSESEGTLALELSILDFPDYGYLRKPHGREVLLSPSILNSKEKESFLCPGDIIIATKGSAGKIAIISDDVPPPGPNAWVVNQSCLIMRSTKDIDPRVLFIYLCSKVGQTLLASIISEATVPLIQLNQLKELDIIVSNVEETKSIIRTFEEQVQIQSEINALNKKLEHLSKVHWFL
ncbi:MAG: N-6 DNA methylase [Nostocaceae cyanobacterium]|nr:N-6 DNA methylase [Nostocaceae cyanobacterium]